MKKLILVLLMLMVLPLTACRQNEDEYVDTGERFMHFAIEGRNQHGGWQNFILVEVNEVGIVTDLVLDGVNHLSSATKRELSQLGLYEALEGYDFYTEARLIEESLIGQSSIHIPLALADSFPSEAGAFNPADWSDLALSAITNSPIEQGPYLNGRYHASAEVAVDGFINFVNFIVVNGHIISVQWNATSEDGLLRHDYVLMTNWDAQTRSWRDQAIILEEELLILQDPMLFTFDEGGYSLTIPAISIEIETFVSFVVQALTAGPTPIVVE